MDPRHLAIDERLKSDGCVYCYREADTRDHVPSKILLDEPYPSQLPTVDACEKCNTGFSLDEEYLSCFIECVLCGGIETGSLRREKIKRILGQKPDLQRQIQESAAQSEDSMLWKPEAERVRNVILKLATGHVSYELYTQGEPPNRVEFSPLTGLTEQERIDFDRGPWGHFAPWPEIGSRAFLRACGAKVDEFARVEDWVIVQPGRYRYAVNETGGILVRIVLSEYLACAASWD